MKPEDLLLKLEHVKKSGGGWTARCPAHDDRSSSLSISEKDGKILLHCFAGCRFDDVLQAVGIEAKDCFAGGKSEGKKQKAKGKSEKPKVTVAEYIYRDENGREVAKKVRYEPKSFAWFRAEWETADVGQKLIWKPGLAGLKLPLYRWLEVKDLPEIVLTEGEKDADAGAKIGLPCATSGGTDSWRPEHAALLAGKHVTIIADADDPGRLHGAKVAASLYGKAASVKMVELPTGKDLAEAIEKGTPANVIRAFIAESPEWKPRPSSDLLDGVHEFVRRYVALTDCQARAVTLWIAHTHAIMAAQFTPYLNVTSAERESGKSRLLDVARVLAANAWKSENVSPSAIVYKIHAGLEEGKPITVLLDERDSQEAGDPERAEVLHGILNSGYERDGAYSRCIGEGSKRAFDFRTFGAKALAGIGDVSPTVASRSIPIRMVRARRGAVPKFRKSGKTGRKISAEAADLKARIAAWCGENMDALRDAEPDIPEELSDRQADCCEPLIAIADLAGGDWPNLAREALTEIVGESKGEGGSRGEQLLGDFLKLFRGELDQQETLVPIDRLSSDHVLRLLNGLETSPWGDWNHGRGMTAIQLAKSLRPFGIVPRKMRVNGELSRGYLRADFEEPWRRYLPDMVTAPQAEVEPVPG